MVFRSEKCNF
ncbi:uncharacterized protein CELE_F59A6.13 [Caenorhabditis elegans]|uniref:Uncharacterized protein n=1 Tax=Caenorhabditis elegans TaxID=6239 RepID=A0A2K5ATR4_CAEEL|nr:Uncharacterized protein CELE_F59A6.13 [Caenorhabditis elegans]SPC47299.1 Uncharacterized protein CELE_F59A6.13 [Caenorhabditis elegans]|eukprot:NP_001348712.1 Uncharacterized protein CELE_F59A6.13 [Caenorhabditis elegans]